MTTQDLLDRAQSIINEIRSDAITPARLGELVRDMITIAAKGDSDIQDLFASMIYNVSQATENYTHTPTTARAAVPAKRRKKGSILSYKTPTGDVLEMFTGSDLSLWTNENSWTAFGTKADVKRLEEKSAEIETDANLFTRHGFYSTTDGFTESELFRCTDFIPISNKGMLTVTARQYGSAPFGVIFDKDKVPIRTLTYSDGVSTQTIDLSTLHTASVYAVFNSSKNEQLNCRVSYNSVSAANISIDYINKKTTGLKPNNKINNLMILGDSMSANDFWTKHVVSYFGVKNIINTACGSARIKDDSSDYIANPYTDRPVSHMLGANKNVFFSQVKKIQRLVEGVDLDSGEVQITPDMYPDLIIIEGGTNDTPDSDNLNPDDYYYKQLSDQWVYNGYGTTTSGNSITVTKPIAEVDKRNFIGSIRHIIESLNKLFPDAFFLVITPHQRSVGGNDTTIGIKKANQIKLAAERMSAPVCEWHIESQIRETNNRVAGRYPNSGQPEGSEQNPWVINAVCGQKELYDGTHPNERGGRMFAHAIINSIDRYYYNIC